MTTLPDIHPDAAALTAVRAINATELRAYTTAVPENGWPQICRIIRQARATGRIAPTGSPGAYAVLDVLDAHGDIVQDYAIPNARAWRWWYRKLHLRVDHA